MNIAVESEIGQPLGATTAPLDSPSSRLTGPSHGLTSNPRRPVLGGQTAVRAMLRETGEANAMIKMSTNVTQRRGRPASLIRPTSRIRAGRDFRSSALASPRNPLALESVKSGVLQSRTYVQSAKTRFAAITQPARQPALEISPRIPHPCVACVGVC